MLPDNDNAKHPAYYLANNKITVKKKNQNWDYRKIPSFKYEKNRLNPPSYWAMHLRLANGGGI